ACIERVNKTNQQEGRSQLCVEFCTFRDTAGNNRRNGCRKCQQKKEPHKLIATTRGKRVRGGEEMNSVRQCVTDEEVRNRRNRKVGQNFDQRVDLIFLAHGAQLQKRKPRMHCQDQDRSKQNEQGITADFQVLHASSLFFYVQNPA